MPRTHLLCYIRRDWLTSWKLDSLERGTRKNPVLAYGSNDPTFARFAKKGNVLWVIGAYPDGPPSLEAKIEVSGQLRKDKEWDCEVMGSRRASSFFGLNDASSAVMQLLFKNNESLWSLREKYSTSLWKNTYGRELQSPRRLAPLGDRVNGHSSPWATPLEELAGVAMNRSVFISWKHSDNNRNRRRFMKALTIQLAKQQFSIWWDKMALTNIEAVDGYSCSQKDNLMERLLRQGLSGCTAILALWSGRYGTASTPNAPNWTRDEWHANENITRIAMSPEEFESKPLMAEPDQILRIPFDLVPEDAVIIARRFKRAYDSINGRFRG